MYSKSEILKGLNNKNVKVEILKETTSTNDYIKNFLELDSCVVLANRQTKGRGRLDRVFYSPENKGVYMSVLIKPNLCISKSVNITTLTAVIVANAIERLSNYPVKIKWVNDLYMNDKKVCGILTEAVSDFKNGVLKHAIIGIGINLYGNEFNEDIKNIATSIEQASNVKIDANKLVSLIINGLLNCENLINSGKFLEEYKSRQIVLGKKIKVITNNEEYFATAIDVLSDGGLLVDKDGEKISVNAGEVSIKL